MASRTDPGNKTPDELEHEVDEERRRLSATAEELQQRLSVGTLIDECMAWSRAGGEQGGAFFHNLGRSVRHNPIPVALTGLGLAWLMAGGQEAGADPRRAWDDARRYLPRRDRQHGNEDDGLGERLGEGTRAARDRAKHARQAAAEGASGAAESMRQGISGASDRFRESAEEGRARARAAGQSLSRAGDTAYWQARDYGRRAGDSMARFAEEQPLVLGAVAFALGAALGGLLPNTRTEDEWMGESAERLRGRAGETLHEEGQKARRVAEAAFEEGRRAAEEALEEASAEVSRAGEHAEAKAREAGERVEKAAEREAERQDLGSSIPGKSRD